MKLFEQISLRLRRATKPHETRLASAIVYLLSLAGIFLILTLGRYLFFGLDHYWEGLLDKLSAALVVAAIGVLILLFLSPRVSYEENLVVLDSWQIGLKLTDALKDTRTYYFRGRSGRWFRTTALPTLFTNATRDTRLRSVRLILPDPDEAEVMASYAAYRNSLPKPDNDPWTAARIRNEILATILEAGRLASRSTFFDAQVALTGDFSLFRVDLSDSGLALTREDPRMPGWYSASGTKFYASHLEDLRMLERRGRTVPFASYTYPATFTAADIPGAVATLGFSTTLSPADCAAIAKAMKSRKSPYA